MEIVCKNCNTSHYISEDKIPLETKTGKCKKCGASIKVLGKNELKGELVLEEMTTKKAEFEGTHVRQFLAHKGSVIIKEFREIEKLESNYYGDYEKALEAYEKDIETYGKDMEAYIADTFATEPPEFPELPENENPTIIISTLILGIVKGKDQQTTFGVKLECSLYINESWDMRTIFIDFDELPELIDAFDFIKSKADVLKSQKCDYTELIYATRDDAQFGFYQETNQEQTAFTKFQDKTAYLKLSEFLMLKNHLLKAQEHLISRGASLGNY